MQGYATLGDVYGPGSGPTFDAATIVGDSNAPATTGQAMSSTSGGGLQPVQLFKSLQGINPLVAIVLLVGAALLYKILREHKREDDFKEARYGIYFGVAVVVWNAALTPAFKALLAKYQLPAISAYVQNA